ncbi:hypothetical protein J6590_056465 [Homalodisca vitripennis]|nr:hypothetical protein J6590_056465 [Homalodisca vitripennis]
MKEREWILYEPVIWLYRESKGELPPVASTLPSMRQEIARYIVAYTIHPSIMFSAEKGPFTVTHVRKRRENASLRVVPYRSPR